MNNHDPLPGVVGTAVATVLPNLPGPTKDEWAGALVAVVALVVRELVWWVRNRRK